MSEKYSIGTRMLCGGIEGTVIENYKMPGDICIRWENGLTCSYDKEWLDKNVVVIQ